MKIYIASHDQKAARDVAKRLFENGYEITSRWVEKPFKPTEEWSEPERMQEATEDLMEVRLADVLILLAGPDKYPGGKFVEAGYALGLGRPVIVVGRRENLVLWHPSVQLYPTLADFYWAWCQDTDYAGLAVPPANL